jgi:hypothetical protein
VHENKGEFGGCLKNKATLNWLPGIVTIGWAGEVAGNTKSRQDALRFSGQAGATSPDCNWRFELP